MESTLKSYLEKHSIEFQEFKHKRVFTVEESKNLDLGFTGTGSKNLFLKSPNGFYLVCIEKDKRLDIKSLSKHLKVPKLTFASESELFEELKLTPGSVSIFGLIYNPQIQLILDESLWNSENVGFHPNSNDATLELDHKNFSKFFNSLPNRKEILKL